MPDDVLLTATNVSRRFGGLTAVDRVSLTLERGEVHSVIGTNGAGKSTLVNVLAGEITASSGRVELQGRDVTRWPQPRRARAGIGRSYQRTTIFPRSTVFENCRLSAQAHYQQALDWWNPATACTKSTQLAHQAIEHAGLTGQAHRIAGTLSHGQKRQTYRCETRTRESPHRAAPAEGRASSGCERPEDDDGFGQGGRRSGYCPHQARAAAACRLAGRRQLVNSTSWPFA